MAHMLPLFVAIPLGVAFIIPMVSRKLWWVPDVLGNLAMACLAVMAVVSLGGSHQFPLTYQMGGWSTPLGIDLRLDGLTVLMLIIINVVGLAAALFSVDYMRLYTSKSKYYSLFLFMVAGMNGVVLTGDMFNLYVFIEIAAISSYALVAFGCEHEELEASFKYMALGSLASGLILIGIAITYAMTGTLNMAHMADRISAMGALPDPLLIALALFLSGFGLKAALVPFHAWLPDAHPAAPAPVSAMLSGVVIKALGVYVIARLLFNVFGVNPASSLLAVLRGLGALSMVVGVLLAIGQWDMKRLFAYHSISQIGYVILGLGVGTTWGIAGGLFHLVNHSVFKSLLFLNAGAVEYATGTRDLKRLGGLRRQMPVTSATSLVASMSIAGIPPFNGFWSKLIIVVACAKAGYYWMAFLAVFVSLITLASFLKVQRYAFFAAAKSTLGEVRRVPLLMRVAMSLLAVLCIALAFLVASGLEQPAIIDAATEALRNGVFSLAGGILR